MKGDPRDSLEIVEFSQSGNAAFDKCVIMFASLALEVQILTDMARSEHFNALLAYGEDGEFLLRSTRFSFNLRKDGALR